MRKRKSNEEYMDLVFSQKPKELSMDELRGRFFSAAYVTVDDEVYLVDAMDCIYVVEVKSEKSKERL